MSEIKRPSKSMESAEKNSTLPIAKKKKGVRDLNIYFTAKENVMVENLTSAGGGCPVAEEKTESVSTDSNVCNANSQSLMSNKQLVETFSNILAVHQATLNQLKSACDSLRLHRTKPALGILGTETSEDDLPLLAIFEKYNLPLQSRGEVENLDAELNHSNDFLKFFVSLEYSMLFNFMFLTKILNRPCIHILLDSSHCPDREESLSKPKSKILEGFICSLIAKEVIIQYRWSGRIEETQAFKELKNVQIVLLSAMVRVDANYTLYQFENDIKSILAKFAQAKKKN